MNGETIGLDHAVSEGCHHCNGTGEVGPVRHPGTRCSACNGRGQILICWGLSFFCTRSQCEKDGMCRCHPAWKEAS